LSRQTTHGIKNAIKEYFAFIVVLIIIPAYILFLIIQKLEGMLKDTQSSIEDQENFKEQKIALPRPIGL